MALTGVQLLSALGQFLNDNFSSTTTSNGAANGTTITDTALQMFGDRANEEAYIRVTTDSSPTGNLYLVRRATQFLVNTFTVSPGFPQEVQSGATYEVHRYDPAMKFQALDRARLLAFPQVAKVVVDETLTSDGWNIELPIPTSIRRGPAQVWAEVPLPVSVKWNVIPPTPSALNAAAIGTWTATGVTAAAYTRSAQDTKVPKIEASCIRLSSGLSGNYSLTASQLNITAANAAGRRFTFGCWIYSRTSAPTISITDDAGTSTSTVHQGLGWEFLTVSRDISGTNATTLTLKINPLTNNAIFAEHAFLGNVDAIVMDYTTPIMRYGVFRDDSHSVLRIKRPAPIGFQYRIEGRSPVSALGTNLTTQTTNTMEVGENDQDLIISTAARILLTWIGMGAGEMEDAYPLLKESKDRFTEMEEDWKRRYPRSGFLDSSFISG